MSKRMYTKGGVKSEVDADAWWTAGEDIDNLPKNVTPGLIPILAHALESSDKEAPIRRAALCRPSVCHIHSVRGFDNGWGCGYRNYLMGLTALKSGSEVSFVDGKPSIRAIQRWMKEAWDAGYDPQGQRDFKGVIVNTKKWIGTADLYAMAAYRGISCKLFNFPATADSNPTRVAPMHHALMRFVRMYFVSDFATSRTLLAIADKLPLQDGEFDDTVFRPTLYLEQDSNGLQAESSGKASQERRDVIVTDRMPLILQHAGHSRTVVGYEMDEKGETTLIVFDPQTSIPAGLRNTSLASLKRSSPSAPGSTETPRKRRKTTGDSTKKELSGRASDPIDIESDEEMDQSGWVRKKVSNAKAGGSRAGLKSALRNVFDWSKNPNAVLKPFRVDLKALSKHDEYQILSFDGVPPLSQEERIRRKIVTATTIIPS